jgi:hypothetical protein
MSVNRFIVANALCMPRCYHRIKLIIQKFINYEYRK